MNSFSDLADGDRNLVAVTVETLVAPSAAFFHDARSAKMTQAEHDRLAAALPALSTIEVVNVDSGTGVGNGLVIAAWNAERLKYHAPSVALVHQSGADILLLSEPISVRRAQVIATRLPISPVISACPMSSASNS